MRLLILTQIVDKEDTYLSFFHTWACEFSKKFEMITVICLKEGNHDLPENVRVLSLGKEEGVSRVTYVKRFFSYVWKLRGEYDSVFVHMNQEYVLLGGWLWRVMGKKVGMWRNHNVGNIFTNIASLFCNKIFCTSKFSYTAKFKKTVFMPVGVSTELFYPRVEVKRKRRSILSLGRIAPSKNIEILLEALHRARKVGTTFTLTICGDVLEEYAAYLAKLELLVKTYGLQDAVVFTAGVPYEDVPKLFTRHDVCVNQSSSGMFDKTIFEAMLCETLVVSCNRNLESEVDDMFLFEEGNARDLSKKLCRVLELDGRKRNMYAKNLRTYAEEKHSLETLSQRLFDEYTQK